MDTATGSTRACVQLDGIRLVNLALDDAVTAIECALAARQPTRIAFINADCANIAARNDSYRADIEDCDWVFVDGIGMRIAGKVMGQPVADNVNGTDLFPPLCRMLALQGRSLYLLGARHGIAAAAADWAQRHCPGLKIAGTRDGYFAAADTTAVLADIRKSAADVLLVAFGAPRQEAWIREHFADTGATVAMGIGGLFDYFADRIPRAPLWMRRAGLEWVFRLIQEPGRLWRRYLVGNLVFLARLARTRAGLTKMSSSPRSTLSNSGA
ncbi:MAG: WecB/TagA/CpsF family glycosyltransferase [Rhodocyclaceae bacterium]|nr:WecB/TagA/CpsF family glycosyltransferase [Rhodocyclaceae bacterium]MDZ4216505.1 WecB/TagA/CpsF family glycosyltransferase [Rhodocyclaceae bacterium]